jgi:hypothetical protein
LLKHKGQPACLLGNGPTLRTEWGREKLEELKRSGYWLIGINKSWTEVQAHYHCFVAHEHCADLTMGKYSPGWWEGERFVPGVVFTSIGCIQQGGVTRLLEVWPGSLVAIAPASRFGDQVWWSADMMDGYHSPWGGGLAIELALWMGFDPIYLIGYDAKNHQGHHWNIDFLGVVDRTKQVDFMKPIAKYAEQVGARVFNANKASAHRVFPYAIPAVDDKTTVMVGSGVEKL